MLFLSIYPRRLFGPGASSTASHRKGISLMMRLTSCSVAFSLRRTAPDAELLTPQLLLGFLRVDPTSNLKIDARWLPPPDFSSPLCWPSRSHNVVRDLC